MRIASGFTHGAVGQSHETGAGFDRWVIDAESRTARAAMAAVMSDTMLPYSVEPGPFVFRRRSPCVIKRTRLGAMSLLDCDVPDVFSGRALGENGPAADVVLFSLMLSGEEVVTQSDGELLIGTGDIVVIDGSRPGTCVIPQRIRTSTLVVPKDLLPLRRSLPDKLPAASPMSRFLGEHIRLLTRELGELPADAWNSIAHATTELLQIAMHSDGQSTDRTASLRVKMLPDVRRFIHRHLADPEMTPKGIAAEHAISVRTLHAMFAEVGDTVSGYIRRRRLEGSHAELTRSPSRTVIDVAHNWGFKNASHFARVFKSEYGVSPRELRRGPLQS